MIKTISTLVDTEHFFHPFEKSEKSDHGPTLCRRIGGIALLALSLMTVGIATGFFTYWAYRKVVEIEKRDQKDLEVRVAQVFGKAQSEKAGEEGMPEQEIFKAAIKDIQKGDMREALKKLRKIGNEKLAQNMKDSLIDAAIEYNQHEWFITLWKLLGEVNIPFDKVKSPKMMRMIIQITEDITKFSDNKNNTVLHIIANGSFKDHSDLVIEVLKKVKDDQRSDFVNQKNHEGKTVLMYPLPLEAVKALVEAGADYPKAGEKAPLHCCKDPEVAKYLIDTFGKQIITQPNEHGRTPLLMNENVEVLRVMIQQVEDITTVISWTTILHYFSVSQGNLKAHPELIHDVLNRISNEENRKEFVNKENRHGDTPLMYTVPFEVVKALLEAGADYFVEGKQIQLHICDDPKTAKYLIKKFGKGENHLEAKDKLGMTPLMRNQNPDVVQVLIDNGAKVDAEREKDLAQPLFFAKSVEVAKKFVAAGAKTEAENRFNQTALFGEISPEVAEWLIIKKGLKVDHKDFLQEEPIHKLPNEDSNVELAKVLMGDRTKEYDWQGNVPKIMQNEKFRKWLEYGKPSQ